MFRPGLHQDEVAPSAQQKCIIVFHYKQPQTNVIPVFSRPGAPFDTRPFSTAKNRNDVLFLDS